MHRIRIFENVKEKLWAKFMQLNKQVLNMRLTDSCSILGELLLLIGTVPGCRKLKMTETTLYKKISMKEPIKVGKRI